MEKNLVMGESQKLVMMAQRKEVDGMKDGGGK